LSPPSPLLVAFWVLSTPMPNIVCNILSAATAYKSSYSPLLSSHSLSS
jgi:hypothetical protein